MVDGVFTEQYINYLKCKLSYVEGEIVKYTEDLDLFGGMLNEPGHWSKEDLQLAEKYNERALYALSRLKPWKRNLIGSLSHGMLGIVQTPLNG